MYEAILILTGLIVGWFSRSIFVKKQTRSGNLIVTSDEDGIYLKLQVKDLADVVTKDEVTFGVITQK